MLRFRGRRHAFGHSNWPLGLALLPPTTSCGAKTIPGRRAARRKQATPRAARRKAFSPRRWAGGAHLQADEAGAVPGEGRGRKRVGRITLCTLPPPALPCAETRRLPCAVRSSPKHPCTYLARGASRSAHSPAAAPVACRGRRMPRFWAAANPPTPPLPLHTPTLHLPNPSPPCRPHLLMISAHVTLRTSHLSSSASLGLSKRMFCAAAGVGGVSGAGGRGRRAAWTRARCGARAMRRARRAARPPPPGSAGGRAPQTHEGHDGHFGRHPGAGGAPPARSSKKPGGERGLLLPVCARFAAAAVPRRLPEARRGQKKIERDAGRFCAAGGRGAR